MQLELRNVCKKVGDSMHIHDVSLIFQAGTLNILLGPTLSGKTSLMRLMAGLDKPTSGQILADGQDVIDVPVQKRNVAMVYQQFINYPNLSVYENIASPLKIAGMEKQLIQQKVQEVAQLLKLTDMLKRTPLELSGGQQQRTALARALVKGADLVLLDEPLANLDYKLREELREELPKIFSVTGAIFVYATTEPSEALLLGGNTATLHKGTVSQFCSTLEVFRKPRNLITAQTMSDPPLNLLPVKRDGSCLQYGEKLCVPVNGKFSQLTGSEYTVAFRPNHFYLRKPAAEAIEVEARVVVTEITGSESYVHVDVEGMRWVVLAHGIHNFAIDSVIPLYLDPAKFYLFDTDENLVFTPDAIAA